MNLTHMILSPLPRLTNFCFSSSLFHKFLISSHFLTPQLHFPPPSSTHGSPTCLCRCLCGHPWSVLSLDCLLHHHHHQGRHKAYLELQLWCGEWLARSYTATVGPRRVGAGCSKGLCLDSLHISSSPVSFLPPSSPPRSSLHLSSQFCFFCPHFLFHFLYLLVSTSIFLPVILHPADCPADFLLMLCLQILHLLL